MKTTHYITFLFIALFTFSCNSDNETTLTHPDEVVDLIKVKEISNTAHTIELYSKNGKLVQGYNELSLRIKEKNSNFYIDNAIVDWHPIMHMTDMQHSCPKSKVIKTPHKQTLYHGFLIFQMASHGSEYWELTINYTIDGTSYVVSDILEVLPSDRQRVTTFTASDDLRYVLALIAPSEPKVAVNDMIVGLFKMNNMSDFSIADHYSIKIDPRMPSMGNHGSPNNHDLSQKTDGFYHGKLSLTMTGYWKINLQLLNAENQTIKGEEVTNEQESSSLYLEIEF